MKPWSVTIVCIYALLIVVLVATGVSLSWSIVVLLVVTIILMAISAFVFLSNLFRF